MLPFSSLFLNTVVRKIKNFIEFVSKQNILKKQRVKTHAQEKREPTYAVERIADSCPYCFGKDFVKRGTRKKKFERVQLYICRLCKKTFTAQFIKGKRYPLHVIIESLNYYNLGYSLMQSSLIIKQKFEVVIPPATISSWISEFESFCPYLKMRDFAVKKFSPKDAVEVVTMAHRQIYKFNYHRAKTSLLLEDFKHRKFDRMREYLESVPTETPHRYFQEGYRISESRVKFNYNGVYLRGKENYATKIAKFVLQAVKENKLRHETLQRFMIASDSVTVATEVPVYITEEDMEHMARALHFEIPGYEEGKTKQKRTLMTGHIDFLQVRNGRIHILDYKPHADKERPIEQLTWYALALSRLTGLRIYEFMCAWFDESNYFEFYPLHIVYKKKLKRRNISLKVGIARPLESVVRTKKHSNM